MADNWQDIYDGIYEATDRLLNEFQEKVKEQWSDESANWTPDFEMRESIRISEFSSILHRFRAEIADLCLVPSQYPRVERKEKATWPVERE